MEARWLLGIFPVWIVGVVDDYGSRLVAFERLAWRAPSRGPYIAHVHRERGARHPR